MLSAFLRFYFRRTVANWRALRRECMARLPRAEKEADVENGKP